MVEALGMFLLIFNLTSGQRRIVGGSDAEDGMYPYAAFLLINNIASCTGSLLTDTWVLTAAHCVPEGIVHSLKVFAGAANRTSNDAQERLTYEVKVHPYYVKNARAAYDIALLMVDEPFNLSSPNIGTISLTSEGWPQRNSMNVRCKALGWGRISTRGKVPDILQHLDVIARHGSDGCPCVARYEQKKLICLEGVAGSGPCMGDSGGPLVCNGREVVGITHMGFTKDACDPTYPDVPKLRCAREDTVVTYYYLCPELNWIRQYVPGVPPTPASCSARATCRPHFSFMILTIFCIVISMNKYSLYYMCIFFSRFPK